ncbi:MAG: M56 family metallopeptidase [Pseudomonadota bacterium]
MIAALINHLWQSTLFCGGAWLITLMLRANSAALRHSIWLIASLKFLVPFSLLFFIGSCIGLPAARTAEQPLLFGDALQSVSVLVAPTSALRATGTATNSAGIAAVFMIWMGVALFLGLRWLLAWRTADSIARAARPAPGSLLDACVTEADIEPAVARVFHPVVLLPAALLGRLSDPQMSAVLAHEHEHIARRDNLKANVHRLVETLLWFHPAVWWIGRQMLEERERACDEAVIEYGHDRADYAGGILEVCRQCHRRAPIFVSAGSGDLPRRVRYILGTGQPASVGVLKFIALLGATAVVATAPLFAGAAHRYEVLTTNTRTLGNADTYMAPAAVGQGRRPEIVAAPDGIVIRNSTLRDLVAFVYGVRTSQVTGGPWLDDLRYDIRVVARGPLAEPDEFDPYALRELTNKLLASQFRFEIYLNQRCQTPCGR